MPGGPWWRTETQPRGAAKRPVVRGQRRWVANTAGARSRLALGLADLAQTTAVALWPWCPPRSPSSPSPALALVLPFALALFLIPPPRIGLRPGILSPLICGLDLRLCRLWVSCRRILLPCDIHVFYFEALVVALGVVSIIGAGFCSYYADVSH